VKTLVLGMGNDLMSDDAVGLKVAERLKQSIDDPDVEARETCLAGLQLLDLFVGFDRVIIVDAIKTGTAKAGDVRVLSLHDLDSGSPPISLHHVELPTVLTLGRALGAKMPDRVRIVGVEAKDVNTFGGGCCPEVEAAIPKVVGLIEAELSRNNGTHPLSSPAQNPRG